MFILHLSEITDFYLFQSLKLGQFWSYCVGVGHRHARAGQLNDDPWPYTSGSSNPTQLHPLRVLWEACIGLHPLSANLITQRVQDVNRHMTPHQPTDGQEKEGERGQEKG